MYTDFKKVLTKENFPCGVATLGELTAVGITKHHLREMCKSRILTRLEYGVYKIETIREFDKRAVIAKALPEAVFCMSDSLYIYGLRNAKPFVSEVAVPRRISYCKCQKIKDGQNIKFRFITKEYELGIEKTPEGIKHYNLERTVCDYFIHHTEYRYRTLRDIAKGYRRHADKNIDRLEEYIEKLNLSEAAREKINWLIIRRERKNPKVKYPLPKDRY